MQPYGSSTDDMTPASKTASHSSFVYPAMPDHLARRSSADALMFRSQFLPQGSDDIHARIFPTQPAPERSLRPLRLARPEHRCALRRRPPPPRNLADLRPPPPPPPAGGQGEAVSSAARGLPSPSSDGRRNGCPGRFARPNWPRRLDLYCDQRLPSARRALCSVRVFRSGRGKITHSFFATTLWPRAQKLTQ